MKPNIILIVADTLRKDAIDNNVSSESALGKLMADSVSYSNAIAPSSWTLPSHISMFTGEYPSEHGVNENNIKKIFDYVNKIKGSNYDPFTRKLKEEGYLNIGVSANGWVSPYFLFDKYFDVFLDSSNKWLDHIPKDEEVDKIIQKYKSYKYSSALLSLIKEEGLFQGSSKLLRLLRFLVKNRETARLYNWPDDKGFSSVIETFKSLHTSEPFFLFLNLMEMHEPYLRFDDYRIRIKTMAGYHISKRYKQKLITKYYSDLEKINSVIEVLISYLKSKGYYDSTVIIFTSDHGQSLFSHSYFGHGIFLYDELIRVPLMIKYAKMGQISSRKEINELVSLVSIHDFVLNQAKGLTDQKIKTNDAVFSEIFGMHDPSIMTKNIPETYALKRKAIYKDGWKLTLNEKGEIEEFFCYEERETKNGKRAKQDLLDEIYKFAKDSFLRSGADLKLNMQTPKK
ncbi:MAG: sulfatase [Candidatus Parvarchaeota archaeon]